MAGDTVLSGDLTFLSLADLLQMLGGNGASGILRLHSPHSPQPGLAYFLNGNPIHAICGDKSGIDALYSLFGWVTGEFAFSREKFTASQSIQQSRMQIILDGLRKLDDGELATLGSSSAQHQSRSADFTIVHGPLADYMSVVDEERFSAGQQIVVEGSHGNWIWVILEGQVDLVRETPKGPLKLLSLGEGAFVGSVTAFTIRGHIRSATCVAATNVVLGVLDLQRLSIEYTRMSDGLRTIALSLDRRLKQLTDRLLECHLGQLEAKLPFESAQAVVFPDGGQGEGIYRITAGQAAVMWQRSKAPLFLARLQENDVVGSIPFADIGHEPHSAALMADPSLQLVSLDPAALEAEFKRLSPTFKNIFENMVNALSVTTMLAVKVCTRASKSQN